MCYNGTNTSDFRSVKLLNIFIGMCSYMRQKYNHKSAFFVRNLVNVWYLFLFSVEKNYFPQGVANASTATFLAKGSTFLLSGSCKKSSFQK